MKNDIPFCSKLEINDAEFMNLLIPTILHVRKHLNMKDIDDYKDLLQELIIITSSTTAMITDIKNEYKVAMIDKVCSYGN